MKKTAYIAPAIKTRIIYIESVLASASDDMTSNIGVIYGGVDEEGTHEPSAKDDDFFWDSSIDE